MKTSDVKINSRKANAILGREEIAFEAHAEGATPKRKEIQQAIATLAGGDEKLVAVTEIRHGFGSKTAKGKANIYKSKEAMEKTEFGYIINRDTGMKKKKGEGETETAAPKKPEKPAAKVKEK